MIPSFGSVLLVAGNQAGARSIAKALIRNGISVRVSEDPESALIIAEAYDFDALILDLDTCSNALEDLRRWIRDSNAAGRVVLLHKGVTPPFPAEAFGLGESLVVGSPPDIQRLSSFIKASARTRFQPNSFAGKAEEIDLLSYLQFLVLDRKETVLEVSSFDGSHGEIFIEGGKILHARFGDTQGEAALFRCLTFTAGNFAHKPWHPPETATITRPADSLLFEAARIRDESKAEHPCAGNYSHE